MTDTFTWRASATLSGTTEFRMSNTPFGDGYRQQMPLGLNNRVKKFTVTVSGYKAKIAAVKAFIDSQNGLPFFWKPPFGAANETYSCQRYNEPDDQGGGFYRITMEFQQEFLP